MPDYGVSGEKKGDIWVKSGVIWGENSRKPVFGFRLSREGLFCKGLLLCELFAGEFGQFFRNQLGREFADFVFGKVGVITIFCQNGLQGFAAFGVGENHALVRVGVGKRRSKQECAVGEVFFEPFGVFGEHGFMLLGG